MEPFLAIIIHRPFQVACSLPVASPGDYFQRLLSVCWEHAENHPVSNLSQCFDSFDILNVGEPDVCSKKKNTQIQWRLGVFFR